MAGSIVCRHELRGSRGGRLVDLLETHRKVVFGGPAFERPHLLSPDECHAASS